MVSNIRRVGKSFEELLEQVKQEHKKQTGVSLTDAKASDIIAYKLKNNPQDLFKESGEFKIF